MGENAGGSASVSTALALVTLLCSLRPTHTKDVIHGRVSGVLSRSGAHGLPPSLSVDVPLDGEVVHLSLQRDTEFPAEVPVFVLSTDSRGREQIHRAGLRHTDFAVYHDLKHEAAFGVYREKLNNDTTQLRLEGVVHSGGKVYDLKSTGHRRRARSRRDVQGGDNADVNGDNNVNEGEEEEEEDFEVEVFAEPAADGSDSLSKPLFKPRKIVMRNSSRPAVADPPPRSHLLLPNHSSLHRRRRQVTQEIYIDLVALADYGVYKSWYDRSEMTTSEAKQRDTLEKLRRYYAFVMNGVNMLYKTITSLSYNIHVRLSSVVVSTETTSSEWTERFRESASQWDEVDASQALKAVSDWAGVTDLLPAYDHLMLFTGYDLSKVVGSTTSDKITGLAYTGTVCDTNGKAASIVEDLGGFQCIGTAAHELGHGLSAEHDGTENTCRSEDRYVMAAGTYDVTSSNKLNPWLFSTCSVTYFNAFFRDEVRSGRGQQCLYNSLTQSSSVPDVTSLVEGQLYDVDEQCRQVYGPESRLCRGPEFGEAVDICTDMFCYDPTSSATCYQLVAARGTTCGNKKWCDSGECVTNIAAPAVDENCVFGDQPGTAFDNQDCVAFVENFPGYCYQDVVRVRCCSSCAGHYRLVKDCEYGDKATGCRSNSCSIARDSYLQSCCGTCNYGTPIPSTSTTTITTTTTTTPTTPIVTTTRPGVTVATTTTSTTTPVEVTTTGTPSATPPTSSTTTTTTTPPTTTSTSPVVTTTTPPVVTTTGTPATKPPVVTPTQSSPVITTSTSAAASTTSPPDDLCRDNSSVTINSVSCATLVQQSPDFCYDSRVIAICCQSCRTVSSGVTGCEYGDRRPDSCSNVTASSDDCSALQPVCCKTCAGYQAPTGGQDVSADVTLSVILCFSILTSFWVQDVL